MSESSLKSRLRSADCLPELPVAGLTPFTTIDFPGRLAAVLFTQGCPWRCHYCFNTELQPFSHREVCIAPARILDFLDARRELLDGIVFSGGEAAVHETLREWMLYVKGLGYAVGLHSAGIHPDRLEKVLDVCDWIGLDIKAPFDDYEKITQVKGSGERARECARLVLGNNIDYEFRTTVHAGLLSEEDIIRLAMEIRGMGARHYAIQAFRPAAGEEGASRARQRFSKELIEHLSGLFPDFKVRA